MHANAVDEDEEQIVFSGFDEKTCSSKKERINIVKSWLKYLPTTNAAEVNARNVDACSQEKPSSQQQSSRRKNKNNNRKRDKFELLPLFT